MVYNLAYFAYGDDPALKRRSLTILDGFFGSRDYKLDGLQWPVVFVASGGSEQNALQFPSHLKHILLLCHRENNSFAATVEIAAFLRGKGKTVDIIDVFGQNAFKLFNELFLIQQALNSLSGQKAALIGNVSEWLIASNISPDLLKSKLGIELMMLAWEELGAYKTMQPDETFLALFPSELRDNLEETAKVYTLLETARLKHGLSAISVECFPMVKRDKVTACLPLSVLNSNGVIAACEGDITSMAGKMLIKSLTGNIPWQANVAGISDGEVLFAHCTAPLNMLQGFDITTHYETDCGTAIKGVFPPDRYAAFRLNNTLDKYMLIEGETMEMPAQSFACRTQLVLKTDARQTTALLEKSLGNHHLLFPAKHAQMLHSMMKTLGIDAA